MANACPTCGSRHRFLLLRECATDTHDPDDWHRDRSNLTGSGVSGGGGQENSQVPKAVDPPSNKKLIERLRELAKSSEDGESWDGPPATLLAAASALEEREGLEAALQKVAEVQDTRVKCVRHGGMVGADEPLTCNCYVALDAAEKAREIARAALNPPPIEKAGTPDQAEIPNLRDVIAVRADLWPKRFPARTDPAPTQPSGGGE